MGKITTVLFDCDGLMFNTERVSQKIWRQEAKELGYELPEDFFVHITGVDKNQAKNYIASLGMLDLRTAVRTKRYNLSFWAELPKDSLNMKGLIPLYQYLEAKNYHVGICSSSDQNYVKTLMSTVSVPLKYEFIIGGDMVSHSKPDPEIFLKGASMFSEIPSACLVLEDSKAGIMAAKRAGMRSVFIEDTIHPDAEMEKYIDLRADDLAGVIPLLEAGL